MKNKEDLLKEKELEESGERPREGDDVARGMEGEESNGADAVKKVAGSDADGASIEEDGGTRGAQEEDSTARSGALKGAKKTSRKELLDLISRKNDMLQRMGQETEQLKQELKIKEDKLLRIAAEFENYKKRTRREWDLLEQRAKAELITDILGVLDDFDRALEALGEREDHVADGVILIVTSLKDVLEKAGVREIEALGARFDPQLHEAVGGIESDDIEEGCIAHVVQKGYEMNDQLLRPAKVIVAKKN